jgi:hypothetical protein
VKYLIAVSVFAIAIAVLGQEVPKVYLIPKSSGITWGVVRDRSHEMAKDFAKACPIVHLTTKQQAADYQVGLNRIEPGLFVLDDQVGVTDMFGNVLLAGEKNSIKSGVKGACALILADWSNQAGTRQKLANGINTSFENAGVMGYAEISSDKITVHYKGASALRFQMILAVQGGLSMARRAGITTYIFTNDADQNFQYDLQAGRVVPFVAPQAVEASK